MNKYERKVLVPYDFTELSEDALQYAIQIARVINSSVELVHIAGTKNELKIAEVALNHMTRDELANIDVHVGYKIISGKFIQEMNQLVSSNHYEFAVIKTDGPKKMERYTGSRAMKIIAGSRIPFLVVQKKPSHTNISRIVFPLDFRQETKEKLNWIFFLSQFYEIKLSLFLPNYKDKGLSKKINNNLCFAQKILDRRKMEYQVQVATGDKDFVFETIDFAEQIDADLILIMFNKDIGLKEYLLGPQEQAYIINRPKIPVMCVNPRTDLRRLAGFN